MSVLQVESLGKSYGVLELFRNVTFAIEPNQKVGLIAPNGAGKSTLLKILVGLERQDAGSVFLDKKIRVAYMPQSSDFSSYPDIYHACLSRVRPDLQEVIYNYYEAEKSQDEQRLNRALEAMEAQDGWGIMTELRSLLDRLHLKDPSRTTKGLSGGESKRIALAAVLLGHPDFLILDEPTNHLDPDIIEWLEEYLAHQPLSLLMVTHDRYFLDKVCTDIIELDNGNSYRYEGNYSLYLQKKEEREQQQEAEQQSIRNIYRRELEWMRSTPQARSSKAKYRKDAFYETEAKLKSMTTTQTPNLGEGEVYIGKKIFEAKKVSKYYGDKCLLKSFSYDFARYDRVGIVGANGVGKTTFLKMIMGLEPPSDGEIMVGETVRFGYFSQEQPLFPPEKKVIEVITDITERISLGNGKSLSAMQFLTRFLFKPSRQQDYVQKLSGGELRRLQLCRVLIHNPNFLVLDEPTNDLDIPTIQVLEDYLSTFNGCLLIVSHDRFFMDRLAEHLFVLEGDGIIRDYPGNYTGYRIQQKEERKQKAPAPKPETIASASGGKPQKEKPKKRSFKEQKEYESLEEELLCLEKEKERITQEMSTHQDPQQIAKLAKEYETLIASIEEKEMRWLELSEIGNP